MSTRQIPKAEWKVFLDSVSRSKELESKSAEIEVLGLHLGDQLATDWVPMYGLVYEERGDMLEIGMKNHTHRIHHPKQLFVEGEGVKLESILVEDADGLKHIIRLRESLSLPKLKPLMTRQ
ncbi:hypothetical protein AAKU67_001688 [Oxalobacteraceae bacterium GrIS 2.11]